MASSIRSFFSPGRVFLSVNGVLVAAGAFLADYNETHVFNPRWPPHAKFHNGQTMSMGLCLGAGSLYYTLRPRPAPTVDSLRFAAILGSMYWVTTLSAILYPETKGMDPEFGEGFPQMWGAIAMTGLTWASYWLEIRRLKL
ncbi:MAG: hypothetical protein Q9190_004890 [Brigantiaea leucoxantha]